MIPKELKALIDTHCMGKKDIGNIDSEIVNLIMDKVGQLNANPDEVMKYMDEMIKGPTKEEREAAAKAEAERKAKEEAERKERERLAAIERAKREKEEAERKAKEAVERKERERLAAIERAEKEKKEAAERAEREKKEAIFQELKKKYPTADISGIGHIQLYQKPIDKWEDEFKASAKRQTIIKIKNIAYWVVFSILLIGAFVCEHLFVHGGWSTFLVVALILVAFGTSGYYRSRGKGDDEDMFMVNTWCAGILWQHYFVHGFWWTTLAIVVIFLIPFIFNYKNHKLARVVTWIVVILALGSFSLFLFTDIEPASTLESVEAVEPIENDDINTVESMPTDENDTELSAEEEYERLKKESEEEYERLKKATEEEYERMMKSFE